MRHYTGLFFWFHLVKHFFLVDTTPIYFILCKYSKCSGTLVFDDATTMIKWEEKRHRPVLSGPFREKKMLGIFKVNKFFILLFQLLMLHSFSGKVTFLMFFIYGIPFPSLFLLVFNAKAWPIWMTSFWIIENFTLVYLTSLLKLNMCFSWLNLPV